MLWGSPSSWWTGTKAAQLSATAEHPVQLAPVCQPQAGALSERGLLAVVELPQLTPRAIGISRHLQFLPQLQRHEQRTGAPVVSVSLPEVESTIVQKQTLLPIISRSIILHPSAYILHLTSSCHVGVLSVTSHQHKRGECSTV